MLINHTDIRNGPNNLHWHKEEDSWDHKAGQNHQVDGKQGGLESHKLGVVGVGCY